MEYDEGFYSYDSTVKDQIKVIIRKIFDTSCPGITEGEESIEGGTSIDYRFGTYKDVDYGISFHSISQENMHRIKNHLPAKLRIDIFTVSKSEPDIMTYGGLLSLVGILKRSSIGLYLAFLNPKVARILEPTSPLSQVQYIQTNLIRQRLLTSTIGRAISTDIRSMLITPIETETNGKLYVTAEGPEGRMLFDNEATIAKSFWSSIFDILPESKIVYIPVGSKHVTSITNIDSLIFGYRNVTEGVSLVAPIHHPISWWLKRSISIIFARFPCNEFLIYPPCTLR